jgi:hypothetical protein
MKAQDLHVVSKPRGWDGGAPPKAASITKDDRVGAVQALLDRSRGNDTKELPGVLNEPGREHLRQLETLFEFILQPNRGLLR